MLRVLTPAPVAETINSECIDVLPQSNPLEVEGNDKEWTLEKRQNRFLVNKGKAVAEQDSKFKAADIKVPLFNTKVDKEVSEADISSYVFSKTKEKITPIRLKMSRERNYNAFKFNVSKIHLQHIS